MHVLFLPTLGLSLVIAGVSFGLTNYLIPGMVRNLQEFVGADAGALIQQQLNRPRGLVLGEKFRIYADESTIDPSNPDRITLHRIAFVEVEGDQWARYGTAREVRLVFDRNEDRLRVSGSMMGLSYYDKKLGHFFDQEEQIIPANEVPSPVPGKIKFLTLGKLLHYLLEPGEWYEARQAMWRLRKAFGSVMVYEILWAEFDKNHKLILTGPNTEYFLTAQKGVPASRVEGITFGDVEVLERRVDGQERRITAGRAHLKITAGETLSDSSLAIELHDAHLSDGTVEIARVKVDLGPMILPETAITRTNSISDAELLAPLPATDEDPLALMRAAAREVRTETVNKIIGAIHERLAFSSSAFVLLILGAVLGIIFRGSHLMFAFGISFVPMLLVIVTIMMGKQMSHNPSTHVLGLALIWSGIVVVAGLDVWTLTRVLRR